MNGPTMGPDYRNDNLTGEGMTPPAPSVPDDEREALNEAIRVAGIAWHRKHDPHWRDNPWKDGISVDLDENDVLDALADAILAAGYRRPRLDTEGT